MWLFIKPELLEHTYYIKCSIEFKIKAGDFVYDTKTVETIGLECRLSLESREIVMNDNTFYDIDPQNNCVAFLKLITYMYHIICMILTWSVI